MTQKEKAKELVGKMKNCLFSDGLYDAKQCATICVDEILSICTQSKFRIYWSEVKLEIEKL